MLRLKVLLTSLLALLSSLVVSGKEFFQKKVDQLDIIDPAIELKLENVSWKNSTLAGQIISNHSQPICHVTLKIEASDSQYVWQGQEQHSFTIDKLIKTEGKVSFSLKLISPQGRPWFRYQLVNGKQCTDQELREATQSAKVRTTIRSTPSDTGPWGVAKQVSEHTWTMKVAEEAHMGTPQEIFTALNNYRQSKGSPKLSWNQNLAVYAQSRADSFNTANNLDEHAGFIAFTNNQDNLKALGFWGLGENSSIGYKLSGQHLIEWIFAGDAPHDNNQLDPKWTHVGIGVHGTAVDLIFGNNIMN